jgi:DNA-binding CsgD family transcriptional regulator
MPASLSQVFYEAAFSDDPNALAAQLGATFGGRSTLIHAMDDKRGVTPISSSYFPDEIVAGFGEFAHLDPWTGAAADVPVGQVVRMSDLVTKSTFQKSAFFNDFVSAVGDDTSYCMAALFPIDGAMGVLAFHRGANQDDFGVEDEQRLAASLPEIRNLLQVRARLTLAEHRARDLELTIARAPQAILHVKQDGRLAYANEAAEEILRRGELLQLLAGCRIKGKGPDAARFDKGLVGALQRGEGSVFTAARAEGPGYQVAVAPLYAASAHSTVALISIVDPARTEAPPITEFMGLFNLTRAEAEIAANLAAGQSVEEISEARQIQIGTARTHLKHILQKTGTRRQGQLVALLKGAPRLTA